MTTDRVRMRCVEMFARELWPFGLYGLATAAAIEAAAPTAAMLRDLHTKLKVIIDTRALREELREIKSLDELERLHARALMFWVGEMPSPENSIAYLMQPAIVHPFAVGPHRVREVKPRGPGRPKGDDVAWRRMMGLLKRSHDGKDLDSIAEALGISYKRACESRGRVVAMVKEARQFGEGVELRGGGETGTVRTVHLVGATG